MSVMLGPESVQALRRCHDLIFQRNDPLTGADTDKIGGQEVAGLLSGGLLQVCEYGLRITPEGFRTAYGVDAGPLRVGPWPWVPRNHAAKRGVRR